MTKNELMEMARRTGFSTIAVEMFTEQFQDFANAILESAAREPGNVQLSLGTSEALDDAASRIRSLKLPTN